MDAQLDGGPGAGGPAATGHAGARRRGTPLRVAHLNDIAFVGSALVAALRECGVDAVIVEVPRPGGRAAWPIRALTAPLRVVAPLLPTVALRRRGFDLIHGHYGWKAVAALFAGVPFVVHCHGTDVRGLSRGGLRSRLNRVLFRRARRVYYATPDLAEWVVPLAPRAIFLPNPIDTRVFAPDSAGAAADGAPAGRAASGPPPRDLLVGVRLDPIKGVDAIESLLRAIVARRPETTVTVVAHGSEVDRVVRAAGRHVAVVPPCRRAELPALLRRHRVAIGQSKVGAIGNYELECMASGLPVVASFRYPNAYDAPPPLVPYEAPQVTAVAVIRLLDDDTAREALSARGVRWVRAHHDAGTVAARLVDDYEAVLARRA